MAVTSPSATGTRQRPGPGRRRLWAAVAVMAAALGFLLLSGLGDATVYFKTADEAVDERAELGSRRFRLEGTVVPGSVRQDGGEVGFQVRGTRGATVDVTHQGDPPELFQPGLPVVLEGAWAGDAYASDRIMVKHTSEYQARHPERVDRYVGKDGGAATNGEPGPR